MKINRDNYEAYFLDFHEGQLSPQMVNEVLLFVEQNPDLKSVFIEFEVISLVSDSDIVFEKKSSLKKNQIFATSQVNELNYEEYLIGETEGILNEDQLAAIEEFISINPQFKKDRSLFALAHLVPDNDIVFEAKDSLKNSAVPVGQIDTDTFESYFSRELEDDLSPAEKQQLDIFMQYNPHLEKDRRLYALTILKAENDVVFENKNSLKQPVIPFRSIVYYALSLAASIALIFSVYFLINNDDIPHEIARYDNDKVESRTNHPLTVTTNTPIASNPKQSVADVANSGMTPPNKKAPNTSIISNSANSPIIEAVADNKYQAIEPLQCKAVRKVSTRSFVDPQFTFIRISQMYMNQNLEFYYNLKLAEEIQYAQVNLKDDNPARTILGVAVEKANDLFASNQPIPPREEKQNLSMWTFAELGIQAFNTITSSEIELNLRKDEDGKVVAYGIESSLVDFERDIKK